VSDLIDCLKRFIAEEPNEGIPVSNEADTIVSNDFISFGDLAWRLELPTVDPTEPVLRGLLC
jgi:hypothetical protein